MTDRATLEIAFDAVDDAGEASAKAVARLRKVAEEYPAIGERARDMSDEELIDAVYALLFPDDV